MSQDANHYNELMRLMQQKEAEVKKIRDELSRLKNPMNRRSTSNPLDQLSPEGEHSVESVASIQTSSFVNRRATMARSKSNMGYSSKSSARVMERGNDGFQAVKRPRVMSQQLSAAPSMTMARSRSNRSEATASLPFVATGPVAPLRTTSQSANIDRFCQSNEDPSNAQLFSLQPSPSQRRPEQLPMVEEHGLYPGPNVGMSPLEFLAGQDDSLISPALMSTSPQSFLSPNNSFNNNMAASSSQLTSGCPSMSSGTSAESADLPSMSRNNSSPSDHIAFDNQSLTNAFEMARLNSTQSRGADHLEQEACDAPPPLPSRGKRSASGEELFAGVGASLSQPPAHYYSSSPPIDFQGPISMARSISMTSTGSGSSMTERRAREARQRQIQNAAKATILPKPGDSKTSDGAQAPVKKEGKVTIAKNSSYTRPKHPKVFCTRCNDNPEGFRGDHELRRHTQAKHESTVKKYICVDPATRGITSSIQAINPLSKCKSCLAKKPYGAYYNAAAHLRRTHFKPKTPRGKNKRGDNDGEPARAGSGGGDWPSMAELKLWFEEIQLPASGDQGEANEEDDDKECYETPASGLEDFDMSFANMGEPYDMGMAAGVYGNMTELSVDTTAVGSAMLSMTAGMMPLSASSYDYSPLPGMTHDTAYSTISSSNTITPSTFQDALSHGYMEEYCYQ